MRLRDLCAATLRTCAAALLLGGALGACGGGGSPGPTFQVGGEVQQPRGYTLIGLQALPAATQTDTFTSAGTPQTHVYTGASLWDLLNASTIEVDAGVKNDILGKYVLATGSDGYRVVFAAGEINPGFGNRPSLVAYAETQGGATAPLGGDDFARVTSPGDGKGGRYVSGLARLDVRSSGAQATAQGGGLSTQFTVSGAVLRPGTYDLAALQQLTPVTQAAGANTYTGVSLWSFLNDTVGLAVDATLKNADLAMYVVATGSDGYRALFSLGELDPGFGAQPDLIAWSVNGGDLGANGFARIVVPNDVKAGRYVSNLAALEVFVAPAAH